MTTGIRRFQPADLEALYRICLCTGAHGEDATALYNDPKLLGSFYAAPYAVHDPDLCLIATADGAPAGYILGTDDSARFRTWSEAHWFPALRARYPLPAPADESPDAALIRLLHAGYQPHPDTLAYPAHLHIDLLPSLRGRGLGRALMQRFLDRLRVRGCPAVHLGVSAANTGGIAFYEKLGFHLIGDYPGWRAYGMKLA
ncbi:MAG TPA: GNAT family N-acetyltransferase [Opitutus sp.]|nr:GNAT family N-acetyltransferase [Opitutus sp.]